MSDQAPISRDNPETSLEHLSPEQENKIARGWVESFKMIHYLLGKKMIINNIEDIETYIEDRIDALVQQGNDYRIHRSIDDELMAKVEELRKLKYGSQLHRKSTITSIAALIDDGDKIVVLRANNEEIIKSDRAHLILEIDFIYKQRNAGSDERIFLVSVHNSFNSDSLGIVILNETLDSIKSAQNAKIVSDTLNRFASDPSLIEKSINLEELNEIISAKNG